MEHFKNKILMTANAGRGDELFKRPGLGDQGLAARQPGL